MAKGDRIYVADKKTLDEVKANTTGILAAVQDIDGKFAGIKRYGVKINKNDSNPATRVTYLYDAVGMNPAKMDFASGAFDFGDWGDIWFVKNNYPCMVKYDGTEDYKLNPNDYTLKEDGTESDVANSDYAGNAMSAIPLVWISQYEVGNYEYIILCNVQYDSSYHAFAHTRADGTIMDVKYLAMFKGSYDGKRLRSLSGMQPMYSKNAQTEIDRAAENNQDGADIWRTRSWADRNLVNCLLTVIGKSDNSQGVFGQGNTKGYVDDESVYYGMLQTGTLNDKGQFFGYNTTVEQVKVFHIEGLWGDQWDRVVGLIVDHGKAKVKMTPPYNLTGEGYTDTGVDLSAVADGYIKTTTMREIGRIPTGTGGSSSTYLCDSIYLNAEIVAGALVGGAGNIGSGCGAACLRLASGASSIGWSFGAALSCEQPSAV
jgi:hypothetical protein